MEAEKKTQVISIRFPPSVFEQLEAFAVEDRRTMNSLVEVACLDYISRNKKRSKATEKATVGE